MKKNEDRKPKKYEIALNQVSHSFYGDLISSIRCYPSDVTRFFLEYKRCGFINFNKNLKYEVDEWVGVFSVLSLFFGLGFYKKTNSKIKEKAYLIQCIRFWKNYKVGKLPMDFDLSDSILIELPKENEKLISYLQDKQFKELDDFGFSPIENLAFQYEEFKPNLNSNIFNSQTNYEDIFANTIVENAKKAIQLISGNNEQIEKNKNSLAYKARNWFISHYPLLGGLASMFEIVEDVRACQRYGIEIAAVDGVSKEIYINPLAKLSFEEIKFVMAHEILHVALMHMSRREARDSFLWNVACDFVINAWLVDLRIGVMPQGLLYDDKFKGKSADEIYYELVKDIRTSKKLKTLRGCGVDILDEVRNSKGFVDADDFCRRALLNGIEYYENNGRGTLPADFVEEVRRLNQPVIPWQVELAEWINERFPLPEQRRSYFKPSRRQSSTPDIPRPSLFKPEIDKLSRVFGVVLDTSGSMDRQLLGKALGSIVSYATAQEIKYVRLVFCDAQPYDEGYVQIETLANRVKIKGRGGTVLQPAIEYLEKKEDFPKDAPILIITDGFCDDDLKVKSDHAFLIPKGHRLPFFTKKPIFYFN